MVKKSKSRVILKIRCLLRKRQNFSIFSEFTIFFEVLDWHLAYSREILRINALGQFDAAQL